MYLKLYYNFYNIMNIVEFIDDWFKLLSDEFDNDKYVMYKDIDNIKSQISAPIILLDVDYVSNDQSFITKYYDHYLKKKYGELSKQNKYAFSINEFLELFDNNTFSNYKKHYIINGPFDNYTLKLDIIFKYIGLKKKAHGYKLYLSLPESKCNIM